VLDLLVLHYFLSRWQTVQVSRTRNMADDTDNHLAVAATTLLSVLSDQIKRKPKRDKWIRPSIVQRPLNGAYPEPSSCIMRFYPLLHGVFSITLHYIKTDVI